MKMLNLALLVFSILATLSTTAAQAASIPTFLGLGASLSQVGFSSVSNSETSYFLGPSFFGDLRLLTTQNPVQSAFHLEPFANYLVGAKKNSQDVSETLRIRSFQFGVDAVFAHWLRGRLFIGAFRGSHTISIRDSGSEQDLKHLSYGPRLGLKYYWSNRALLTIGVSYQAGNQRFQTSTQNISRLVEEYSGFVTFSFRVL